MTAHQRFPHPCPSRKSAPRWTGRRDTEVAVITQTTLSVGGHREPPSAPSRNGFPGAVVRNDICYATTNRQDAVYPDGWAG